MNLKKEINLNKKFIVFLVFISIIAISLYYSYALFQVNVIKDNVVVIQSASSIPTITTTLTIDNVNTNSNSFTLPANSSQTITVNLTVNKVNDVTITSAVAYKMYYELTGNGTFTVTSSTSFPNNKIEGSVTGTKTLTLTFTNNSSNALTITLGAISGFEKAGASFANKKELLLNASLPIVAANVSYSPPDGVTCDDGTGDCTVQKMIEIISSMLN